MAPSENYERLCRWLRGRRSLAAAAAVALTIWIILVPLFAFRAILGGPLTFGPVGFLIGPVILSLLLSIARIYRKSFALAP